MVCTQYTPEVALWMFTVTWKRREGVGRYVYTIYSGSDPLDDNGRGGGVTRCVCNIIHFVVNCILCLS